MMEMEPFSLFYEEPMAFWWGEEVLRLEPAAPPVVRRSAFKTYERETRSGGRERKMNVHRRVVEYLRRMPVEKREKTEMEYSRSMRHMMRERQRRERLSQSYAELYRMILPQPKTDKNSIVQAAVAYLQSLRRTRDALQQRRQELSAATQNGGAGTPEGGATIKFRVGNPSSPVDSMIAALQRLKILGVKARSIRSGTANRELFAAMDVQTEMTTNEVENAVQGVLVEVEWKLRNFPKSTPPRNFQRCQA